MDVAAASISSTNASSYYMDTNSTARKFNSVGQYSYEYTGATVCFSGQVTGVSCGTLTNKSASIYFKQGYVYNLMEANMYSQDTMV